MNIEKKESFLKSLFKKKSKESTEIRPAKLYKYIKSVGFMKGGSNMTGSGYNPSMLDSLENLKSMNPSTPSMLPMIISP